MKLPNTIIAQIARTIAGPLAVLAVAVAAIPVLAGAAIAANASTDTGFIAAAPVATASAADATIEAATEADMEQARVVNGVAPLRHSAILQQAAENYAKQMAAAGFFSHTDPKGLNVADRVHALGYEFTVVGENLARVQVGGDCDIAAFAVANWMKSPGHHANIVSTEFAETAIGVCHGADGKCYFVQVFGKTN